MPESGYSWKTSCPSAQQVSWITAANYGTCKTCGWRGLTSLTRLYASSVSRCLCWPVWTSATATILMTSQSTFWQQLGPRRGTLSQKSTCQVRTDSRPNKWASGTFSPPQKRIVQGFCKMLHFKRYCRSVSSRLQFTFSNVGQFNKDKREGRTEITLALFYPRRDTKVTFWA